MNVKLYVLVFLMGINGQGQFVRYLQIGIKQKEKYCKLTKWDVKLNEYHLTY